MLLLSSIMFTGEVLINICLCHRFIVFLKCNSLFTFYEVILSEFIYLKKKCKFRIQTIFKMETDLVDEENQIPRVETVDVERADENKTKKKNSRDIEF